MSIRKPEGEGGGEDVDERFRAIMDAEFGTTPPPDDPQPARPTGGRDFNLTAALDEVTPDEPAEPFIAPVPAPLPRPRGRVAVGAMLLGGGLLVTLAALLGVGVDHRLGACAIAAMAGGLALLLVSIPRTPRDPWDDGTRL